MAFMSDVERELAEIKRKTNALVEKTAVDLYSNLVEASPVGVYPAGSGRSGGELKRSWQPPVEVSNMTFVIRNIAPHAIIIDGGRRQIPIANGALKWVGSEMLPKGFKPIVQKAGKKLNQELKNL